MKKIYMVGLGPGKREAMTYEAVNAIRESEVIVGYDFYVGLIGDLAAGKEVFSTPMKKEMERCKEALDFALQGKTVAFVCSGDAGVYGMAGIMMEVAAGHPEVEIEVVCGVTAACSAAGVMGAPLIHDFAVVSLSDLLTPWEKIEKRLDFAAKADFVICLYNPYSKKRTGHLARACQIMLRSKSADTKCGYVKNIGREGECHALCTLEELKDQKLDMFTTVIVGNSETVVLNGRLVTPRGYQNK